VIFERIAQLERGHIPFALATVVVRRSPVSSHLGDHAIVLADGRMEGFVGGSCSRDIVRRQALEALRAGKPRLLRIRPESPDSDAPDADTIVVPMGCASEGAVDVYIEPRVPARALIVAGCTPVAHALRAIAAAMPSYRVVPVVAGEELRDVDASERAQTIALSAFPSFLESLAPAELARSAAIAASQGHYDEAVLTALLRAEMPAFVGLLASRKRAAAVFGVLAQGGIPRERIAAVRNPVGLDIGARSPDAVAISILAELVSLGAVGPAAPVVTYELDPVCGMEVEAANASHRVEHGGTTYYFCCAHCRAAFSADPLAYVAASAP
jgi:xanthine dehydrogenase accessory factor